MDTKPKYLGGDSEIVGDEKRQACYSEWSIYRDYWESVDDDAGVDIADFRSGFLNGYDAAKERVRLLLKDVMGGHCDPNDAAYNGCDSDPCKWCQDSREFLEGGGTR